MIRLLTLATALALGVAPAVAQMPSRASQAIAELCSASARDSTPLPRLAAAAGASETKNPLWPEYRRDGYPEKAFGWADAPDTFVFMLEAKFVAGGAKEQDCTILIRKLTSEQAKSLADAMQQLQTTFEGGLDLTFFDHGRMGIFGDTSKFGKNQFTGQVTLEKHARHGEVALISIARSPTYLPPGAPVAPPTQ